MILEDLAGRRFGCLTVLEKTSSKNKHTMWLCRCDCGTEKAVNADNLVRGLTRSCGCAAQKRPDITGQRFGRLVALERVNSKGASRWRCRCDCGAETTVLAASLRNGSTTSCGCRQRDAAAETGRSSATHRASKDRLYRVWQGIKNRVHNPKCERYMSYGGRGIKMCPEWEQSFEAFRDWALLTGYDPAAPYGVCTIDRIDVNGNYEPSNCRWVDLKTQATNKRT